MARGCGHSKAAPVILQVFRHRRLFLTSTFSITISVKQFGSRSGLIWVQTVQRLSAYDTGRERFKTATVLPSRIACNHSFEI